MSLRITLLLQAVTSGDKNAVSRVLSEGADVNGTNDGGQTPLILAIVSGQDHLVSLLLNSGANPLLRDNTGLNAIDWAERKGRTDLKELLARRDSPGDLQTKSVVQKPAEYKKGEKPADPSRDQSLSSDEKSRRWLAGLKQRLDEKASREQAKSSAVSVPTKTPTSATSKPPEPAIGESRAKSDDVSPPTKAATTSKSKPPEPAIAESQAKSGDVSAPTQAPNIGTSKPLEPIIPESRAQSQDDVSAPALAANTTTSKPHEQVIPDYSKAAPVPKKSADTSHAPTKKARAVRSTTPSKPARSRSSRKRCPQCNTIYNSDLLTYCAYHVVPLVDADAPIVSPPSNSSTPLLWILILVTVSTAAFAGFLVTRNLFKQTKTPETTAAPSVPSTRKGLPVLGGQLVGKELSLPAAEVPLNVGEQIVIVTTKVKVNKAGRVISVVSSEVDRLFREAAIDAAKRSTFSADKLEGRGADGTIKYVFNQ